MEYKHFYTMLAKYMPSDDLRANKQFIDWILEKGEEKIYSMGADFMMLTLPNPRVLYYQSNDYFEIQRGVTGHANQIMEDLGFFPIRMDLDTLQEMEKLSQAILFLGLIFDIIILLFIVLSVLLIYSLLMISVESKTFEFGVMRMIGLSKSGIINTILIQAIMFVLPAVVLGFAVAYPTLVSVNSLLFTPEMGLDIKPHPSGFAVLQACIIGLVIPFFSSIAPI